MCFGGGGSDSSSKEMVQMQKDEAAQARQKEAERQARINSGLERIRQAFEGAPVMGTRKASAGYDWSKAGAGLPSGFKYVPAVAAKAASPATAAYTQKVRNQQNDARAGRSVSTGGYTGRQIQPTRNSKGGYSYVTTPGTPGSAGSAGSDAHIVGPDGKIYRQGDQYSFDEQYDTGERSGGIGEDFFNKFRQSMIDYYSPQVQKQYEDAKKELTYRLARAGTLRSSVASEKTADLAEDKKLRDAEVLSKADTSTGDLRTRVAGERAKAESQLYATENPDVAANQALASIRDITAEEPTLTPLGELFSIASIGGANFLRGASSSRYQDDLRKLTKGYSTEIG